MSMLKLTFVAAVLATAQSLTPDNQPREPFRIADHLFYVGSSDIGAYLITTERGHILIDAGYPETAAQIEANVAKLGLRVADIKILLNTQAHFDHAGGFAELKRASGARLLVSEADAPMIEQGGRNDFALGDTGLFPATTVDQRIHDGEQVRIGDAMLTANLTPGHTKGCTTWTWEATDRGRAYHVVDLCGLTILGGTRVSGMPEYPQIARDYEHTFERLKSLPAEIFLGAHAGYYGGAEKAAALHAYADGANPFVDPSAYRTYVALAEQRFRAQLARERQ